MQLCFMPNYFACSAIFSLPFCNPCKSESPIRLHSIGKHNATQFNSIIIYYILDYFTTFYSYGILRIQMFTEHRKCVKYCLRAYTQAHAEKANIAIKVNDCCDWLNKSITENPSFWLSDVWIFVDILNSFPPNSFNTCIWPILFNSYLFILSNTANERATI